MIVALSASAQVFAAETLKVAVGQRISWTTAAAELGEKAGIFAKHGLKLDIVYVEGGGETIQAAVSGAVDVSVGVGTSGVMAAYKRGAPVKVIGNCFTGVSDFFWYVRADSALKSFSDVKGHSLAYSAKGTSSDLLALALQEQFGVKANMITTGGSSSTLTAVMSGQVDIGYAAYTVIADYIASGKVRVLVTGEEIKDYKNDTVRVIVANGAAFKNRHDDIKRFVAAYQETIDWMYSEDPKMVQQLAKQLGFSEALIVETRKFYPKDKVDLVSISGLDRIGQQAIDAGTLKVKLSPDEIGDLFVKF